MTGLSEELKSEFCFINLNLNSHVLSGVVCLDSHKLASVLAPLHLCFSRSGGHIGQVKDVSPSGRLDGWARMNNSGEGGEMWDF